MQIPLRSQFAVALIIAAGFTSAASATTYDVRAFGAKGDGTTKDTAAFQKALDTCAVNGGGDVLVPAGKYLIGSIQIGNRTILRLEKDSILAGSSDIADYPLTDIRWEGRWQPGHRGLIYATAVDHIGIVGPGRIEGSVGPPPPPEAATAAAPAPAPAPGGAAAPGRAGGPGRGFGGRGRSGWGTNGPDGTRNPVVIEPISCNDVRWDGFTLTQGGNWATHPTYCTNLVVTNVSITGNRDGIDVDSCSGVRIDGCTISTGDDSISLKSGRGMDGARLGRWCEDILITNCTLSDRTFACVGIGSETSGGVRNVRIEHCKCTTGREAIYIKTRIGRAGGNENISGDDLDVTGPTFLRLNLTQGGNNSTADDPVEGLVGYPYARDISFSNIRVNVQTLVQGIEVSAKKPMSGLTLTNITGTCTKGISLANMSGVALKDINVTLRPAKENEPTGPLLGIVNVTGTGLEGAVTIPAPVDPAPGNAPGGFRGGARGGPGGRGGRGGAPGVAPAAEPVPAPKQ